MMKDIGRVHGKHHTFQVKQESTVWSTKYYLHRDDGKTFGSYSTRAAAFRAAHEKAGPGAYETE